MRQKWNWRAVRDSSKTCFLESGLHRTAPVTIAKYKSGPVSSLLALHGFAFHLEWNPRAHHGLPGPLRFRSWPLANLSLTFVLLTHTMLATLALLLVFELGHVLSGPCMQDSLCLDPRVAHCLTSSGLCSGQPPLNLLSHLALLHPPPSLSLCPF